MKTLFTISSLFLSFVVLSQNQDYKNGKDFTLTVNLQGRDTGFIILRYPLDSKTWIKDTNHVINGKAVFTGKIGQPSFSAIKGSNEDGNYTNIYLEKGDQTILLQENHFSSAKMIGSDSQSQYDSLKREIAKIEYKFKQDYLDYDSVNLALIDEKDSSQQKISMEILEKLSKRINECQNITKAITISFIEHNPDSYVSATALYSYLNRISLKKASILFNLLTEEIKNSFTGILCLNIINEKKKTELGHVAPDFTINDINGKSISLSKFKGKYVLLDFWASWCIPCRENGPYLIQQFRKYHKRGLEIIGISQDSDSLSWKNAVKKDKIDIWNQILSVPKTYGEIYNGLDLVEMYGVNYLPTYILIDPTGIIIARFTNSQGRENSLSSKLEQLLD